MGISISGNIVNVAEKVIFGGTVYVDGNRISRIERDDETYDTYILPGFIDAHVHIESSMLIPSEFARLAVLHGTVATVSDPHEIANVLGIDGIRYMIANGNKVPFKFYFGASSCVPATSFETAGASIDSTGIRDLLTNDQLLYLSEMMNYPGVWNKDPEVMEKIRIAKELGKLIDGHAPGLKGDDARRYIEAGISTDHESFTLEEALDKIKYGMNIIIREGSAAKNYEALHSLLRTHPDKIMFCSDDKHPSDLVAGEINEIVKRSVSYGYDTFDVLYAACVKPVSLYGLDVGLLRSADPADFIIVNNLKDFNVLYTYINGRLVADNGKSLIPRVEERIVNNFNTRPKRAEDFAYDTAKKTGSLIRVIEALNGQLMTNELHLPARIADGKIVPDIEKDVLKLTVVNRYSDAKPSVGFIKNFGLKQGAIASCVAHDSHNIISAGVSDEDICAAVNAIIESKGGISASYDGKTEVLPLPVGGIMSNEDGYSVAKKYIELDKRAKELGSGLNAPYMTLSFMALLVIPQLKLSDKGLFDGKKFEFVNLFV